MSIAEFIRESVLRPRLKQSGCLVVYDAEKRYRDQCFDLATEKVRVVDASDGSIESRESALLALRDVGQPKGPLQGVLIYWPCRRPESDEQKQKDPFALYAACGAVFPNDDGDEYLSLCLRARPDHATGCRTAVVTRGPAARPGSSPGCPPCRAPSPKARAHRAWQRPARPREQSGPKWCPARRTASA